MAVATRSGKPRLTRGDWKTVLKRTVAEFKSDDVPLLSASVAFRLFLALIPSLIAAVAVLGLVIDPAQLTELVDRLRGVVPPSSAEFIGDRLKEIIDSPAGSTVALIGGVAGGLFAATTAALALVKALNRAYDVEETRKFVKLRLLGLLITGALGVALAGVFVALVVGPQIVRAVLPDQLENGVVLALTRTGRYLLAVAILVAFFAFIFRIGPNRAKPRWRWVTPGALVGVVGWLLLSLGFSLYAASTGSYAATYGTLAGIFVLLVWLNLSFLVLLMGAELDSEIERLQRERDPRRAPLGKGPGEVPSDEPEVRDEAALAGAASPAGDLARAAAVQRGRTAEPDHGGAGGAGSEGRDPSGTAVGAGSERRDRPGTAVDAGSEPAAAVPATASKVADGVPPAAAAASVDERSGTERVGPVRAVEHGDVPAADLSGRASVFVPAAPSGSVRPVAPVTRGDGWSRSAADAVPMTAAAPPGKIVGTAVAGVAALAAGLLWRAAARR